ncbi:MAG: hypothetical protein EA425_08990 [Puniceicoccaceae bacterium]|nr:MAG: hypothetical protein EA425_08990 [Puniceicoccaceae bacterium]
MKSILVCLGLLVLAASAFASPETVARNYFAALKDGKWKEAADLFDPKALHEMRLLLFFLTESPEEQARELLPQFFGPGATPKSVRALDDRAFFAAFLGTVMNHAYSESGVSFDRVEILGTVAEGEDVVHVVARTHVKMEDNRIAAMEVVSLRQWSPGRWGLLMKADLEAMAHQMRSMVDSGR